MGTWILIVLVSGWGAGIGSKGNSIASIEFASQEKCIAASKVVAGWRTGRDRDAMQLVCVPK